MRSLILFAGIQAIAILLGSSDTATISLIVLVMGAALFVSGYLLAFKKGKRNKKNIVKAVFEIQ